MPQTFSYSSEGRFRILQLTDLHYEDGGRKDRRMLELVRSLVSWEQPDLIMVTGDISTSKDNAAMMGEALRPVTESGVPFAYVFGNHDAELGAPHRTLVRSLSALQGCVNPKSAPGVPGHSNYSLSLGMPHTPPEWLIIGLDSGMYNSNRRVGGYDFIRRAQISWYLRQLSQRQKQEGGFGALCFLHIPLPEYVGVYQEGKHIGSRLEPVCCPGQNSGLYSAMLEEGHTRGVFAGHDHLNDDCSENYGITLCYGRASGYSTYGKRGFLKGGRIIELRQGVTDRFTSWVRLSDGEVKDRFTSGEL